MISSCQKSCSNFLFVPPFSLTERTFWRQQPWERCRKHVPWGEKLPQASESLFTTSCACYFHQNRALSFSPALFLCFWQKVVIVKHWLHCAQRCGESIVVHGHGEDKRAEMVGLRETPIFLEHPGLFYRLWRSVFGRSKETCYVTEFSQPLILSCTPSSSIRRSVVSGGHVCHNLLGTAHSRYWRRRQKINKLDWAAWPRGRSPYPGLHCSGSTLLHQASLFTAVWVIKLNFIKRSQQQKEDIHSTRLFYFTDFHLPSRQTCNHILSMFRKCYCLHLIL